jgi:DNA (cytosine-5)-methyltransferase 1
MRFGSVCSGIEAASVAWHPLGWQAAWLAEIEPFPSAVLKHHYPEVPNLGDMTALPQRIRAGEVEAPDLFCGGTPCQAFSVAGLRQSLSDDRGNLSLIFVEIANAIDSARSVRRQAPSIIFWENVPGVLSTKDNAFGCFLGALAGCDTALVPRGRWTDAGVVAGPQRTVAWRTLDAQYFGLAQRRKRVFVVASARAGFDPAAVLLEREGVRRDSAPSREAGKGVARGAAPSPAGGELVGTIGCNTGPRGHGFGDFLNNQSVDAGHLVAFGGNRTSGSIDITPALLAQPGSGWKGDFESETFITHPANYSNPQPGDPCHPLAAGAHRLRWQCVTGQGYWMQDDIAGTIDAHRGQEQDTPIGLLSSSSRHASPPPHPARVRAPARLPRRLHLHPLAKQARQRVP